MRMSDKGFNIFLHILGTMAILIILSNNASPLVAVGLLFLIISVFCIGFLTGTRVKTKGKKNNDNKN